jgi:DMSO/TMAO reductase YedYZ heme-binding membrane subunit
MVDFTGHGALICLLLALIARPISHLWSPFLAYRRVLGVSAFVLSFAHTAHMVTMGWNPLALPFLLPGLQVGGWAGIVALGLMVPLAATSFNQAQIRLGHRWRQLHLLSVPIFVLAVAHALLLGSSYLGGFERSTSHWLAAIALVSIAGLALLTRWRGFWLALSLEKFYAPYKP